MGCDHTAWCKSKNATRKTSSSSFDPASFAKCYEGVVQRKERVIQRTN